MRSSKSRLAVSLAVLAVPAAATFAATPPPINTTTGQQITLLNLTTINTANGVGEPLELTHAPGAGNRKYIATHGGHVFLNNNGATSTFLNLDDAARGVTLAGSGSGGDERGLLGLAFHPNFSAAVGTPGRGKFYTHTSEGAAASDFTHPELTAIGSNGNHRAVIREWTTDPATPDVATAGTSRVVFSMARPQGNHNGGALRFDPAGNLYIGSGDGGGGNDHSPNGNDGFNNTTDGHTNDIGNGQDLTNVYGKILRINPLQSGSAAYTVPAANPFAGSANNATKIIYAYGMRNPFRFSIDPVSGNMFVGDVGQGQREEVDLVRPSDAGKNYGWPFREGTLLNSDPSYDEPAITIGGPYQPVDPIAEYDNNEEGVSIAGGFVYRGSLVPQLVGKYVFGDLRRPTIGRLFYTEPTGGVINELRYNAGSLTLDSALYSLGQDANGELYAMLANGKVLAIVPEPNTAALLAVAATALTARRRRRSRN